MRKLPRHVAIIMDGNGRWAEKRRLRRVMGHRQGAKAARDIVEACAKSGIKALTLYAFSTENWKRPKEEVETLMRLLERSLRDNADRMKENNVRFNVIGQLRELPESLQGVIGNIIRETAANSGIILTLALNYGGRQEILNAAKLACRELSAGGSDASFWTEENFEKFLYTFGLPELDFIIRTSGEMRLSNFLIWQAAYAELYVTDTLWPDFNAEELEKALEEYGKRERRFGG